MSEIKYQSADPETAENDAMAALQQVVQLLKPFAQLQIGTDMKSFYSQETKKHDSQGIRSIQGNYEGNAIRIKLELVRTNSEVRINAESFFQTLGELSDKTKPCAPEKNGQTGETSLSVELKVQAIPMTLARSSAFLEEIGRLNRLAIELQKEIPEAISYPALRKQYANVSELLQPVIPWKNNKTRESGEFRDWCQVNLDLLKSGCTLALEGAHPLLIRYALSSLAHDMMQTRGSLGHVIPSMISSKGLMEIVDKAPDVVSLNATSLSLGSNPYELGNEVHHLLQRVATTGKGMIITGSQSELQAVFQGGQGMVPNPLLPVVRHVPPVLTEALLRFELDRVSEKTGGLSTSALEDHQKSIEKALSEFPVSTQIKVLSQVVRHELTKKKPLAQPLKQFIRTLDTLSETLSGLSHDPRSKRSAPVSEQYIKGFTEGKLLEFLRTRLLAQDRALTALVDRLQNESLMRPDHQPLCYCAQGTPATGKSQSARLIAEFLGIPYVNIDAASIPDFYTASAQLLGSGRGIVNSYQPGRLEQAAKHHKGILIEVSDLDHAKPQVRSSLADLFLQALENGEAQSATGEMFSVANCIFAFTINLPDGMDETIRKSIGFGEGPAEAQIMKDVIKAVKDLFSSAFISRIGTPILFDPLNGNDVTEILVRGIRASAELALQRLAVPVRIIEIESDVGIKVLDAMKTGTITFGARKLLEHARQLTSKAVISLTQSKGKIPRSLVISTQTGAELIIKQKTKE
jgi:hypothetical protein